MSRPTEIWWYVFLVGKYSTTEKSFLPPPEPFIFIGKGIQSEKWNIFICLSDSWIMPVLGLSATECCQPREEFVKAYTCCISYVLVHVFTNLTHLLCSFLWIVVFQLYRCYGVHHSCYRKSLLLWHCKDEDNFSPVLFCFPQEVKYL